MTTLLLLAVALLSGCSTRLNRVGADTGAEAEAESEGEDWLPGRVLPDAGLGDSAAADAAGIPPDAAGMPQDATSQDGCEFCDAFDAGAPPDAAGAALDAAAAPPDAAADGLEVPDGPCAGLAALTSCDDGDLCTVDDVCLAAFFGPCVGVAVVCDDENLCTDDYCVEGGCVSITDDTNTCTYDPCMDFSCVAGECVGAAVDCTDGDGTVLRYYSFDDSDSCCGLLTDYGSESVTGAVGSGRYLDGDDYLIDADATFSFGEADAFGYEAWVNPDELVGVQEVFGAFGGAGWRMLVWGDLFYCEIAEDNVFSWAYAPAVAGTWQLIRCDRPSADELSICVDGECVSFGITPRDISSSAPLRIGGAGGQFFSGSVDEVRVTTY